VKERYLAKRIQNIIGDSELDDELVRALSQEIERYLEKILTTKDVNDLYYTQGYIAALRSCIEKARYHNKRKLIQEEEED